MSTEEPRSIAERAYSIWEQMGRPEGQALDHWVRAEAELAVEPAASIPNHPVARMPRRARRTKA